MSIRMKIFFIFIQYINIKLFLCTLRKILSFIIKMMYFIHFYTIIVIFNIFE